MLDALEPRSGSVSSLPAPLLVELEEIEGTGGPTHIQGVSGSGEHICIIREG
jgi:hypothetical protein